MFTRASGQYFIKLLGKTPQWVVSGFGLAGYLRKGAGFSLSESRH